MAQNLELALRIRSQLDDAIRDLDRLDRELRDVDRSGDRAGRSLGRAGSAASRAFGPLLAGLGGAALLGSIVRNTVAQEQALAQLEARLRSTQGAAGLTRDELVEMASALQRVTTVGDEATLGAQALLLTFTRIGGEVFPRALEAVLDMSEGMGQGLQQSAVQLGKALNDPIQGITALQRVGVQFTDQQREQIRTMVEAGRVAEAQGVILDELETQFGGAARAARDTLGGALKALKNAFGDLLEGDASGGGIQGAQAAIEDLVRVLEDPGTVAAFQSIIGLLAGLTSGVVGIASEIGGVGIAIREQVQIIQGTLPELERIDSTLRGIEDARKGFLARPAAFIFTSDAELDALEAQLKAERELILARRCRRRRPRSTRNTRNCSPRCASRPRPWAWWARRPKCATPSSRAHWVSSMPRSAKTCCAMRSRSTPRSAPRMPPSRPGKGKPSIGPSFSNPSTPWRSRRKR
jgi:hypothetical protein